MIKFQIPTEMAKNYDNWEMLARADLRIVQDKQIALDHSRDPSIISSSSSSFSSTSQFHDDQTLVQRQRHTTPTDYSDLKMDHTDWKAMLPLDKQEVVFTSASLRFFLDQRTGKNSFMLGFSKLQLLPGKDSEQCWNITYHPNSRFSDVIELVGSWGLFIGARIKLETLSPKTFYAAYLVFGYKEKAQIVQFPLGKGGNGRVVVNRTDGWMEVQIRDFYVGEGDNGEIDVKLLELGDYSKSGLIVEGIEFRPSETPISTRIVSKKNEGKRNRRPGKGMFSNFRIS